MSDEFRARRRAYEVAKALERGQREPYLPVQSLESRDPETITPEARLYVEQLTAASETARVAWQASLRVGRTS